MAKPVLIGQTFDTDTSSDLPGWLRVTERIIGVTGASVMPAQTAELEGDTIISGIMEGAQAVPTMEAAGEVVTGPPAGFLEYWAPDGIQGAGTVTSWDGATSAFDFTPGTAPTKNTDWPGTKTQALFERASNHQLNAAITSTAKSYTFGFLIKPVLNANWNTLIAAPTFGTFAIYLFDPSNAPTVFHAGGGSGLAAVAMTDAVQTLIYTFDATGNVWELFRDGVSLGTAAYADSDLATELRLGSQNGGESGSFALRAMVLYESVLSGGDIADLHDWLNTHA